MSDHYTPIGCRLTVEPCKLHANCRSYQQGFRAGFQYAESTREDDAITEPDLENVVGMIVGQILNQFVPTDGGDQTARDSCAEDCP